MTSDELDRDKRSTEDAIDSLGKWMIRFTAVVVLGLFIEYNRPFSVFLKTYDWKVLVDSIGGLLVTGGVAGELLVEFNAHRKEERLRTINDQIELRAASKLRAADERIADSNERAAMAEQRAAEANLEIAKLQTPRTLNPEQQELLINVLKPFAGQRFTIGVSADQDSLDLCEVIKRILESSGWIFIPSLSPIQIGGRPYSIVVATGVMVRVAVDKLKEFEHVALFLSSALRSQGIYSQLELTNEPAHQNAIDVTIGSKPLTVPVRTPQV